MVIILTFNIGAWSRPNSNITLFWGKLLSNHDVPERKHSKKIGNGMILSTVILDNKLEIHSALRVNYKGWTLLLALACLSSCFQSDLRLDPFRWPYMSKLEYWFWFIVVSIDFYVSIVTSHNQVLDTVSSYVIVVYGLKNALTEINFVKICNTKMFCL
jgi:hypothetical protein